MRIIVALLFLLVSQSSDAQVTGVITGFVKDIQTGEPLIGAAIQVESTNFAAVTDMDGFFAVEDLPTTTYNISVSYIGYKPLTKYNVTVRSAGNKDLNFNLEEVGFLIEGVVVRPDPFQKSKETPLSIQKLSLDEIQSYPGGDNDIAKVIQSLPGVSSGIQSFRNDVIIRGGAPNEVVYYLDGIEIPNINHFATQGSGGGPVSLLNVAFFEGVTLTTSAFSAQYDNALSGILQFDQRNGNAKNNAVNLRVGASEAALTMEGPLWKQNGERSNTTYIVSLRRSYLQFLFKLIGLPFLPDYWDYQFKVNHKLDDYNEINVIGLGSIDDFSINIPDDLSAEAQSQLDQAPIINQHSNTVGVSWKKRFKRNDGFLRTALSYTSLRNDFARYSDNQTETGRYFSNESVESEVKLRSNVTQYLGGWKLSYGFSLQNAVYRNLTDDLLRDRSFDSQLEFIKYGFFSQASHAFLKDRLTISFGIRVDGNTFTNQGNQFLKTFSPRIALSTQLDQQGQWKFNLSAGRYFKLPPSTILGFKNNINQYVNQNVSYIRSDHYVAGFEWLPRNSSRFTLEGFLKKYKNYPVSVSQGVSLANLGAGFEVYGSEAVRSIGLGKTYGLEFLFQQKLNKHLYAILSYTYYRSEFTNGNNENYVPSLWDNRHLFSFTGGLQLGKNWELGLKFRYLGEAPYAQVDILNTTQSYPQIVFDYSTLGQQRTDAFNALDVRIDKKWNFPNWSFNVYVDITNLYAAALPQTPVYGLARDETGTISEPRKLVQITDLESGQTIPTLGIVIDF